MQSTQKRRDRTTYRAASMERETGFEPATFSLARRRSTPEPPPRGDRASPAGPPVIPPPHGTCQGICFAATLPQLCRNRAFLFFCGSAGLRLSKAAAKHPSLCADVRYNLSGDHSITYVGRGGFSVPIYEFYCSDC